MCLQCPLFCPKNFGVSHRAIPIQNPEANLLDGVLLAILEPSLGFIGFDPSCRGLLSSFNFQCLRALFI